MMSDGLSRTNGKGSEERNGPEPHNGEPRCFKAKQARFCRWTFWNTKVAMHGRPHLNPALDQLPEYHPEQGEDDDHQPPGRFVLLGFLGRAFAFVGLHDGSPRGEHHNQSNNSYPGNHCHGHQHPLRPLSGIEAPEHGGRSFLSPVTHYQTGFAEIEWAGIGNG
jgi:hypothetical protein